MLIRMVARLRWGAVLLVALATWLLAHAALAAPARHILDLDTQRQPAQLLDWGDFLIDTTGTLGLPEVLALRDGFEPTHAGSGYRFGPGQTLWIKFTVPATPEDQRWYVKLPAPTLDSAVLYTLTPDRTWNRQASGDLLPVSSWPIPHLYPVLPLAVSAADPTWYVLRIQASEGYHAPVEFLSESRLSREIQRLALGYGAYLGLLAMGAVFALATGVALRDAAYLWFGLWAATALAAVSAATGVAGLHLWADSPGWTDTAPYLLPAFCGAALVMYVAEALLLRERDPRWFRAAAVLAVAACAATFFLREMAGQERLVLALGVTAACAAAALGLCVRGIRRQDRFAVRVLVALAPLFAGIPASMAALLQLPMAGAAGPSLALAAIGISVPASYLVLALRSQERRDHRRRISQLGQIDPTTGLVNEAVFAERLVQLIEQSRSLGHQGAVAIVDFGDLWPLRDEFGRKRAVELLLRLAGRLTSILRTVDSLARLGDTRFGILIEGPLASTRAKSFGSKVIARCIAPMGGMPQGMVVRPKVALALVPEHGANAETVMQHLEALLRAMQDDASRNIGVVDSRPVETRPPPEATSSALPDPAGLAHTVPGAPDTVTDRHPD
jgi:two-component system, sensor histidine kinase LadS